ncbi:unnamed protein product [Gongylonema pulchrum]|uniref:Ig-like domain-containing protein n=1 Tax=Gongylonema pulchrum TaxID=637853 RepID=A0A3P6PT90_9BILA|nr:unnamed protein product [Gongylonema pulchrum]
MQIVRTSLSDAGNYSCVALNRAGEASLDFEVEILCTHLASEYCRNLENRHIASVNAAYARRREEHLRLLAERNRQRHEEQLREQTRSYKVDESRYIDNYIFPPSSSSSSSSAAATTTVLPCTDSESRTVHSQYYTATREPAMVIQSYTLKSRAHHSRFHSFIRDEHYREALSATPLYPYYNYSLIGVTAPPRLESSPTRLKVRVRDGRLGYSSYTQDTGPVSSSANRFLPRSDFATLVQRPNLRKQKLTVKPITSFQKLRSQQQEKALSKAISHQKPCIPKSEYDINNRVLLNEGHESDRIELNRAVSGHRLRRPHHFHHRYPDYSDDSRSKIWAYTGVNEKKQSAETNDVARSCEEYKEKYPWGGKRLRFQRQWQPWDPDYSDEPWTSWYSYKEPKIQRQRRELLGQA